MTEREKAAAYITILKNEGYLDRDILATLTDMFDITNEEAVQVMGDYKPTEHYKKAVTSNLLDQALSLLKLIILGGIILLLSAEGGFGFSFSFHAIVYGFAALVILIYMIRLLKQRFEDTPGFLWLKNPATAALLFTSVMLTINVYQLHFKSYLNSISSLVKTSDFVLSKTCVEQVTSGRSPHYYFRFETNGLEKPFDWDASDHYYSFNGNLMPNRLLKVGDTVHFYMKRADAKNIYRMAMFNRVNTVYDIESKGKRFLNIETYTLRAKASQQRVCSIAFTFFVISLLAFLYYRKKLEVVV